MFFSSLEETARVSCSQHSPSAITQGPETLSTGAAHRGYWYQRLCVTVNPLPWLSGPSAAPVTLPSVETLVFSVACSTHTLLPSLGASQARTACWKGSGGKTTILQPFSEQLPVIHGQGGWIHWMGSPKSLSTSTSTWWYSQYALVIYTRN